MKTSFLKSFIGIILLLFPYVTLGYSFTSNGIYYNIISSTDKTVEVTYNTKSNSYSNSVTIPSTVTYNSTKYNVTRIGIQAFNQCTSLISVSLPSTIKSIEQKAFYGCSKLNSIILPNALETIGTQAFYGSSLTEITIPASVTTIQKEAFGSPAISTINYASRSSKLSVGNSAFLSSSNSSTTKVNFPSIKDLCLVEYENLNANPALYSHNIYIGGIKLGNSIVFSEGIKSIPNYAFYECTGLTSIVLPSSLISIGISAFSGCQGITSINIPSKVESIDIYAFAKTNISSLTIPNNVQSIGKGLLSGCKKLKSLTIEDGDTELTSPFYRNYNGALNMFDNNYIETIYIGRNIFSDSDYTSTYCYGMYNLQNVIIGPKVTELKGEFFNGCTGLTSINNLSTTPQVIDNYTFSYTRLNNCALVVPTGCERLYAKDPYWGKFNVIGYIPNVQLNDKSSIYSNTNTDEYEEITYTRNFSNTKWQALYVPFDMNYENWSNEFDVAEINNFHEYDDNNDGIIDRTTLEVIMKTSGNIEANTPYLIRAKEEGEKTIMLTDATLYTTEENTIDCSSVKTKYTFTGTYNGVSGQEMYDNGYYALAGGSLKQAASSNASLGAFRWYLKAESRKNNVSARAKEIKVCINDNDFEATDISDNNLNESKTEYFTLSGNKVANANASGVYVVKTSNGSTKKFIKR